MGFHGGMGAEDVGSAANNWAIDPLKATLAYSWSSQMRLSSVWDPLEAPNLAMGEGHP